MPMSFTSAGDTQAHAVTWQRALAKVPGKKSGRLLDYAESSMPMHLERLLGGLHCPGKHLV